MQLLQRNTRFLLTWLPAVLLICSGIFFFVLKMHVHHMQEKQLLLKQTNVWNAFTAKEGSIDRYIKGEYEINEEAGNSNIKFDEPTDTILHYENMNTGLPFEKLTSRLQWKEKKYLVTTYISSKETTHLILKVFITEAIILFLLLIAIVFLNRKSSRFLWKPFFSTMQKIKKYDITRSQGLDLPLETGTDEFNELNISTNTMIGNVNTAYYHQKQFVENASHEIQTPLAIIRSKLELLINQPGLTERNASLLEDIIEVNNRLSQLNRTLLLLAKIENNQFPDTEPVNLSEMLIKILSEFENHYDNFPQTTKDIEQGISINVNKVLIEVLIANLVKNAIVHNEPSGQIRVVLSEKQLVIENSGQELMTNPDELFDRFKKASHETKTTGLGLALVKQICNIYGFIPAYQYQNKWHRVSITFA